MAQGKLHDLVFKHLIEIPKSGCVFCSTRDQHTGRASLFLFFDGKKQVYRRNGIKGTWDELKDQEESRWLRQKFDSVFQERKVPCYSTTALSF